MGNNHAYYPYSSGAKYGYSYTGSSGAVYYSNPSFSNNYSPYS